MGVDGREGDLVCGLLTAAPSSAAALIAAAGASPFLKSAADDIGGQGV